MDDGNNFTPELLSEGTNTKPGKEIDVSAKVLKYEHFLNDVLREDLRKFLLERDKICTRIAEYEGLKTVISRIEETSEKGKSLKTEIDFGCNFYVKAVVPNTSHIFIHVGFGFFVEFTMEEAKCFIDKKVEQLNQQLEKLTKDTCKIKAHIKMVYEGLRELQGISEKQEALHRDIF
ncbi:uxt prefoldin-like subunit [Tachypleus tridentatus]|uniref:uxt prefoldin-like subunit n=1 Tax=Tachypleus tridentatus TaxID=6853 RepID=UPI003FD2B81F